MRFEPKLIPSDELPLAPDGEVELSDDLALLGRQLGNEAARLAACYPPRRAAFAEEKFGIGRRWSATAAALFSVSLSAAAIVGIVILWPGAAPVPDSPSASRPLAPAFTSVPASTNTTISLIDLSGPELEALFDLIEDQPNRTISVSF